MEPDPGKAEGSSAPSDSQHEATNAQHRVQLHTQAIIRKESGLARAAALLLNLLFF
jgi:hypothetical protein